MVCCQEHFFTESHGQTGYIQDRLKRVRRSLAPEAQQRPHTKSLKAAAALKSEQISGEKFAFPHLFNPTLTTGERCYFAINGRC